MSDGEPVATNRLSTALCEKWWIDEVTVDDGAGVIEILTSEAPDLRAVYDAVERLGDGGGTVTVDGPSGAWAVDHVGGEVRDVRRVGGEYTVHRLSPLERFFHGLTVFGLYVIFAAVVTAVTALFLTTPLSLLGVDPLVGSIAVFVLGINCMVGGVVAFLAVPGLTSGEVQAHPGDGIDGFDELSPADRAALIATDDAKSERNLDAILRPNQALGHVGSLGFAAYLVLIGWVNAGAVGVLVVTGLYALWTVFQVGTTLFILGSLDPLDDGYVNELYTEIREAAGWEAKPDIVGFGDVDAPIQENVAMAVPSLNLIFLPLADVEKLHRDELQAMLAHEYAHVQLHSPLGLVLSKAVLVLLPGIALLVTGATPSALVIGGGLLGYFALVNAVLATVRRRWEYQADAFACEVASPHGLAFALTRLTDQHVIDATDDSILSGPTGELYGSYPYPHRRMVRVLRDARE